MSSTVEFFDILYLGIFTILSPAFDRRFHGDQVPPPGLVNEISHAVGHFHSILNIFSLRFIVFLGGEPVAISYIVDKLLAEFAAASVVFANAVAENYQGIVGGGGNYVRITAAMFAKYMEGILKGSYPKALFYYSRCLERHHPHFIWTGPDPQIFRRTEDLETIIGLSTAGEMLDNPADPIYLVELESAPPSSRPAVDLLGKRPAAGVTEDATQGDAKKKKLRS